MADRVFFCPDCRTAHSESALTAHGYYLQCPGCKLVFTPSHLQDLGTTARKLEGDWSRYGLAVRGAAADRPVARGAYRSPLEPLGKKRRRPLRIADYFLIWGSAALLLAIAGVMILIARPKRTEPVRDAVARAKDSSPKTVVEPSVPAPKTEPAPDIQTPAASSPAAGPAGDWDALDEPLANPAGGEIVALRLNADGSARVQSRIGLETETSTGQWRLTGTTLTVTAAGAKLEADLDPANVHRLQVKFTGQKPIEFTRRQ